jgi:hypothetical protein
MNSDSMIPVSPVASLVARICTTLAIAAIGFGIVIVALAYYNHDVPESLVYRWKHYPEFVPYFFSSKMAVFASVGLALLAACCKPSRGRIALIGCAVAAVVAHAMWEGHLRN